MIDTEALRKKVIDLAIQGKLTQQLPEDGNAEDLYTQIQKEKARLIKEGKIKKEKQLLDITDDEIPFEIPNNWKFVRFSTIITLQSGQDLNSSEYNSENIGIPYITGASNYGDEGTIIINRWTDFPKAIALHGDILLSCKGTVGKIAILDEPRVHIARQIMGIRTYSMNVRYIRYFIERMVDGIKEASKGLIPGIERNDVLKLCCPIPPLSEQERIVNVIETAISELDIIDVLQQQYEADRGILKGKIIDAGIRGMLTEQLPEDGNAEDLFAQIQAENAKLIKEGRIKKEKLMPEISDDEIPFEIPKNWKWIRFNELGVFGGGKTPSMSNSAFWTDGIIPWITSKDMKQKYISTSQMLISEGASQTMTIYPSKSILFVVRSGILKRMFPVAIALENTTINQDLKALRLHIPEMCEYVYYVLKGLESIILFKYAKEGTTVNNINFDSLLFMPIPLPPLEEQKRIVSLVEELLAMVA